MDRADAEPEAGELDLFHDETRVDLTAADLAELIKQAAGIVAAIAKHNWAPHRPTSSCMDERCPHASAS